MNLADDILDITTKVTREWTKQRKAEERGRRSRASRVYVYSDRLNFTDVAHQILPAGYAHASGNGRYTVDKRQFYYAVRDQFREATGREITGGPHCLDQKLAFLRYTSPGPRGRDTFADCPARPLALVRRRPLRYIANAPGETALGSAGEQPTKG